MVKQIQINLAPDTASDNSAVRKIAATLAGIDPSEITNLRILKRSVDARKKSIRVTMTIEVISCF